MRPKFFLILLLAGAAGLAAMFYLKPAGNRPPAEAVSVVEPGTPSTQPAVAATPVPQTAPPSVTAAARPPATAAPEVLTPEEAAIKAKLDLLTELQANYDTASLQAIHHELTNTNPIIRHAAIEAVTQFRDRASIPVLQALAARTTDPEEKQELQDAVEFLTLPTYTEVMAEKKRAKAQAAGNP